MVLGYEAALPPKEQWGDGGGALAETGKEGVLCSFTYSWRAVLGGEKVVLPGAEKEGKEGEWMDDAFPRQWLRGREACLAYTPSRRRWLDASPQ